jgi:hypothetical protein
VRLRKHLRDDLTDDEKDAFLLVTLITLAVEATHQMAIEGTRLLNLSLLCTIDNDLITKLVVDVTVRKVFAHVWSESNPPKKGAELLDTVFGLYR